MSLLVDSHSLIRAVDDPSRLRPAATTALQDPANELVMSVSMVWEIAFRETTQRGIFEKWIRPLPGREHPFVDQRFAEFDANGIVDIEDVNSCSSNCGAAKEVRASPPEMPLPFVTARVE